MCCVFFSLRNPTKIPRVSVEKALDRTNAYRLLIRSRSFWDAVPQTISRANHLLVAGTEAWTSQEEVELAASEPAAALELALAAALELGAVLELALVRASSSSATAPLPDGASPPPPRHSQHRWWPPHRPRSFPRKPSISKT